MYKMVVVVRKDLKMSKGKLCSQVSHAVLKCGLKSKKQKSKIFSIWEKEGSKKIILKVNSLEELISLKNDLDSNNIINSLIKDAGKTFFDEPTITVLAAGPDSEERLNNFFGDLKLL